MADPVLGFLLTKLNEFITNEINLVGGADEKVRSLHRELRWIGAFLRDADAKYNQDERIKCWVDDVRDLAYDVEDAIDTFLFNMELKQQHTAAVGFLRRLKAQRKLGKRIDRINRRIVEIDQRKSTYGIQNLSSQAQEGTSSAPSSRDPRRRTSSYLEDEVELVGVGEVVDTLVSRLIGGDSDLTFVSIVGMGGLGKTTVAKKIYNRVDVRRHFDSCHAWVGVSQEYNRRELLKVLLKQLMVLPREEMERLKEEEEEVVEKLLGVLKEQKYLIVLDDVRKIQAWDDLKFAFPDTKNGSRIMLTTRNKEVAMFAQSRNPPPYHMRLLDHDESWELFLKKAFSLKNGESICCPLNLENLGKDMVKKCGGLPLAIIVIGGLLSTKLGNAPDSWEKVQRSRLWELREGPCQIETILALSYNDLPYELKLCFLYCGMYQEDTGFGAERLIHRLVAEGFLQEREEESMEEVGEDFLEQLISRSMIHVAQRYGKVRACRLHDLLRDLAISEAKKCDFFRIYSNKDSFRPARVVRRCITYDDNIVNYVNSKQATRFLRSFLSIGAEEVSQLPPNAVRKFVGGFQLLRVLDLRNVSLVSWPEKIVDLIHLRYLSVRCERLESIPVSITNLRYLQTFDLWGPATIGRLPIEMGGMQHLRHLMFNEVSMPKISGINHLRNLQTLVSVDATADGSWIKDELQFFTNLRSLGLKNLSSTHMTDLYQSIGRLNHLNHLNLHGDPCPTPVLSHCLRLKELILVGTMEKLPELHQFPPNLRRILLSESELRVDPFTTLEGLPTLGCLELWRNAYNGKEMRCSARGFPQIERLELYKLGELERLSVEKGGMPNLRHLEITSCRHLEMPLLQGLDNMILTRESRSEGNYTLARRNP